MDRIRELRKARGLSMKDLGAIVGCSESAISCYELGKRSPDYEMLLKLSEALETTVSYLLGESIKEKEPAPDRSELFDEMAAMFNSLSEADQQKALGYLAALRDKDKS